MASSFLVFLDIGTLGRCAAYHDLPPHQQQLWLRKAKAWPAGTESEEQAAALYPEKAPFLAEWGQVFSLSVAYFHQKSNGEAELRSKTLQGEEGQILAALNDLLEKTGKQKQALRLAGHNILSYDLPFLVKRYLLLQMEPPKLLRLLGQKPWDWPAVDTMELWRMHQKRNTSLAVLAESFGLPYEPPDPDNEAFHRLYYQDAQPQLIHDCTQRDAIAAAQVYRLMQGWPAISREQIVFAE